MKRKESSFQQTTITLLKTTVSYHSLPVIIMIILDTRQDVDEAEP